MPNFFRFTIPVLFASAVAAFALSACGGSGSSSDEATSALAKYIPADAVVYVEGSVRPDQELTDNVNELATKLTGKPLSDTIDEALAGAEDGDVSYEDDVEPWLGENAALYVSGDFSDATDNLSAASDPGAAMDDVSSDEDIGVIADTTDVDASEAFIDKAAAKDGATDGEYEGFSYKVSKDDDSVLGIVDDYVVFATSEDVFKSMVDASEGDSLEDTTAFGDVSGKAADGSLLNIYVNHDSIFDATEESGFDLSSVYKTLGSDPTDTGTIVSLVPTGDEISLVSATNLDPALVSGDPSAVLETFPADSLFTIGTGDVGENATKIIDAIDKEGIEGVLKPGQLDQEIDKISNQGFDVRSIVESLETVGVFVSGDSIENLGGALVATTSDPAPLKSTLGAFSSLIGLAGDAKVKPLGGGQTGFSVKTPELPGRPIVIALEGDRLVIAVGQSAAKAALSGKGETLVDSDSYKAAEESLNGENVDMFADPAAIADVVDSVTGNDPATKEITDVLRKFTYLVSGSGSEDNSAAINVGVGD